MRISRKGLIASALTVSVLAVGGSAVAANDPAAPSVAPADPNAAPPAIGAVQPDQAAAFRVLRRDARPSDAMPADVVAQAASPGRFGRNPELARAVDTATGRGWVVPGRDTLCLVVPDPGVGYGVSCKPTAQAAEQGISAQLVSSSESTSSTLLPDGARVVVVQDDASTDVVRPDASGMASSDTSDAQKLTVVTDEGRSTLPVPEPDGTVAPVQ